MYDTVIETSAGANNAVQPTFWQDSELGFLQNPDDLAEILSMLTGKTAAKPNDLITHLHRIYFCFEHGMADVLFAALLDLLIVLDGKGQNLARRILSGCRDRLNADDFAYLNRVWLRPYQATGNGHSLFTRGVQGSTRLLEHRKSDEPVVDPLQLANDFIEYSQLESAMIVLETALFENPERLDIQDALAELYRSTENRSRFLRSHQLLQAICVDLSGDWQRLAQTLTGKGS